MAIYKNSAVRKAKLEVVFNETSYNKPAQATDNIIIFTAAPDLYTGTVGNNVTLGDGNVEGINVSAAGIVIGWQADSTEVNIRTNTQLRDYLLPILQGLDSQANVTAQRGAWIASTFTDFDGTSYPSMIWDQSTETALTNDGEYIRQGLIKLFSLNAVTTGNTDNGYVMFGNVRGRDWLGNVLNGFATETIMESIDITITGTYANGAGRGITLSGFTAGDLGISGIALAANAFRFQTDGTDGFFPASGGDTLQCFPNSNAAVFTNIDDYLDELIVVLNNPADVTFRPQAADALNFTASRPSTGVLRLTFKNGVNLPVRTLTIASQDPGIGTGAFAITTNTLEVPVNLALADDAGRLSLSTNSVYVTDPDATAATPSTWTEINFSRGSTLRLNRAFNFVVGDGLYWVIARPDSTLTLTGNSRMTFYGPQKGELWNVNSGYSGRNTTANPCTGNIENGSSLCTENVTSSSLGRTTLTGSHLTDGRFVINYIDGSVGWYSVGSGFNFQADTPAVYDNYTINLDFTDGGQVVYEPRPATKLFTAPKIFQNNGTLQFNGGSGAGGVANGIAENYTLNTVPLGNMDFTGETFSAVGYELNAFQTRDVWFKFFNPKLIGQPYFGNFVYSQPRSSTAAVGGAVLGRLWNPSWTFGNSPITNIRESYFYGTQTVPVRDASDVLIPVKEGIETGNIGTLGTIEHPFATGITFTSALTETNINATNLNSYKSNNTESSSGWGDTIDDYDGLFLAFAKHLGTTTAAFTAATAAEKLTATTFNANWYSYTRRNGYRPYFTERAFNAIDSSYTQVTPMDPLVDGAWQTFADESTTTLDGYISTLSYLTTGSKFDLNIASTVTNWNEVYRGIENKFNARDITNINDIPNATDGTDGTLRRLVNIDNALTASGDINCDNFNVDLSLPSSISPGTGTGAVTGFFTPNILTLDVATDYNTSQIGSGSTLNIDANATNGIFTASTIDTSGITITSGIYNGATHTQTTTNVTNCTLGPETTGSTYIVNHSGGQFQGVTMASSGTLNTNDGTLHGLTADNITINYTGTTADFSVDSPGEITNSSFTLNSITQNIVWNIDEDLSTCSATNTTSFNVLISIGTNGVAPTAANLTGNFEIARRLDVGVSGTESYFYRIEQSSDGALIKEEFTTAVTGATDFSSTSEVDVYVVRANAVNKKPILLINVPGNINTTFEDDTNLNAGVQSDTEIQTLLDTYTSDISLDFTGNGTKTFTITCQNSGSFLQGSTITITPETQTPALDTLTVTSSNSINTGSNFQLTSNFTMLASRIAAALNRQTGSSNLTITSSGAVVTITAIGTNLVRLDNIATTNTNSYAIINTVDILNNSIDIVIPFQFTADGTNLTTSSTFWDANGGRGSGQYVFKLLERQKNYALTVLAIASELIAKSVTQLITLAPSDRVVIQSQKAQLHSQIGATTNAFYPGEFVNGLGIPETFSIVGSPNGIVVTYQTSIVVSPDELALAIFANLTSLELIKVLNMVRLTRENMNNLGILAPINDSDPS